MTDFTGLETSGRIATPEDADWDAARVAWNLTADQRPEAVVFAEGAADVAGRRRLHRRPGRGRSDDRAAAPDRRAGLGLAADPHRAAPGMAATPEMAAEVGAYVDKVEGAMRPWAADGSYYNFSDRPCDVDAILPADVCARLAAVKREWDPENRVLANHAVVAAEA